MAGRAHPPEDPGRPTPREAIARARAEAGPRVARAVDNAGPKVEKAAERAGKLLGTLRERAKDTARQFSEGYTGETNDEPESGPDAPRRRPRPRPYPHRD